MIETADSLMEFWTDEVTEPGWYKADPAVDAAVRQRFGPIWQRVRLTGEVPWADAHLAVILLCDQFSRNMHRGLADAFATDPLARKLARTGIADDLDLSTPTPLRQFWYMPLTHSEDPADQDDAVSLIADRLANAETLLHARAHRQVIRQFGRFPFRNEALGRKTTPEEARFLSDGGYPAIVRLLREEGAANTQSSGAA